METIHGAPSFTLRNAEVELAVTQTAGHMGPVTFHFPGFDCAPYSLAPWTPPEVDPQLPPLVAYLRGDYFCLPFGAQKNFAPHGEVANGKWNLKSQTSNELILFQKSSDTGATVTKRLTLVDGQHAIYSEHIIENLEGNWSYGNHPILDLSKIPSGAGRVATSAFRFGSVYPGEFSDVNKGERGALKPSARFDNLRSVPMKDGTTTDLTRYPARDGFEDLIMLANVPATAAQPFGWTAVTFGHYVWFQIKNVSDFPATLFWISNRGRSAHPWEKRHVGRLGLEEVCTHFSDGVDVSREDRLAKEGVPTTRTFQRSQPVRLPIIQAVATVSPHFGQVQSITPAGVNSLSLLGKNGEVVIVPLNWKFINA